MNLWKKALLLGVMTICTANIANAKQHLQASSTVDQAVVPNVPTPVVLNSIQSQKGIQVTGSEIVIKKKGLYLISISGQVTGTSGTDYLDLWLRVNGVDVANSNTRELQDVAGETSVLSAQTLIRLERNDVVQAIINGPSATATLDATTPAGEPIIPSIHVSIVKVNKPANN